MERSTYAIGVKKLQKSYKDVQVLQDVTFKVPSGSIFALLGANGAGKTTTINILTTLLKADAGTATVDGYPVDTKADEVRKHISLTGQFAAVDEVLTGRENLMLIGELRHIASPAKTAEQLLAQFDLTDAADRRTQTYSGGMRRRLDIAMSLIGDPSVIFLDEPTTGLDPQSRTMMWAQIKTLSRSGKTIFLTTQYLEEADQLADMIAILSTGKIIAEGTPAELKKLLPQGRIELRFLQSSQLEAAARQLQQYHAERNDEELSLMVTTDGSVAQVSELLHQLQQAHIEVAEFSQKSPTLDEAFLKILDEHKEKQYAHRS